MIHAWQAGMNTSVAIIRMIGFDALNGLFQQLILIRFNLKVRKKTYYALTVQSLKAILTDSVFLTFG